MPHGVALPLWRDLLSERKSFSDVLELLRQSPKLSYLTVDTTSVCDLTCPGMCYYHPDISTKQVPIAEEALTNAIQSAHESLHLQNLVFAGKEPLLGVDRLLRLVRFAGSLSNRSFAIGLVTNGRGITRNWCKLDALVQDGLLDFMDISIDSGFAKQHDAIRGREGTFDLAFDALTRCTAQWPDVRVGVTSVLRHDNLDGILEIFRCATPYTNKFFVTPIQPPPFSDTPPLPWSCISAALRTLLHHLETEWQGAKLEVMVSLLGIYVWDAHTDGFFDWDELQEDSQGQVFIERQVGGNTFALHMQVLPETACRVVRITHTGAYLPNTHFVQDRHPDRFAVGNIAEESLTVLYARSLADDGILARMYQSRFNHSCQTRPCWAACFGGLTAAEHSLVSGLSLHRQPRLCLKTEAHFTGCRRMSL